MWDNNGLVQVLTWSRPSHSLVVPQAPCSCVSWWVGIVLSVSHSSLRHQVLLLPFATGILWIPTWHGGDQVDPQFQGLQSSLCSAIVGRRSGGFLGRDLLSSGECVV